MWLDANVSQARCSKATTKVQRPLAIRPRGGETREGGKNSVLVEGHGLGEPGFVERSDDAKASPLTAPHSLEGLVKAS